MGLHLIKTEKKNKTKCTLSVDNQAALSAIKSKMNKSGQHLAADLLRIAKQLIECCANSRFQLTLRWSAGHIRIAGNEDVDKAVKAAADGESSAKSDLPPCLRKPIGCQEAALTRRIAWRRSRGGIGLGLPGKQLHPATPELTAWRERPADSSQ